MGTDKTTLDELLGQRRTVGVAGCEIVLTTPSQEACAEVRRVAFGQTRGGLAMPEDVYGTVSEVAVLAVAATLVVGDEVHPSGDRMQAARLVRLAVGDAADVLFGSDLTKTALELCGVMPAPKAKGKGKAEGKGDPPA